MKTVTWIPDRGQTIVFDTLGPFFLTEITSPLDASAVTEKAPGQDGTTTYSASLNERSVNLVGAMRIFGSKTRPALVEYHKQRTALHQAFAPHRWGTLIYHKEDESVQVRCRPVSIPTISAPILTYSTIDIDFVTDRPFWETAVEYIINIGVIERHFHFPWIPRKGPMGAFNRFAMITNPTEELIYPKAEVYSTGQYVTLTNRSTSQYIKIEHAIADGQKLAVDLSDASAFLYTMDASGTYGPAEDVSHWMSLDSNSWGLAPGLNQIAVTNSVPEDTPITYFRYRVPRLGV